MLTIKLKKSDILTVRFNSWGNYALFTNSEGIDCFRINDIPDNYYNEVHHFACSSNLVFAFKDNPYRVFCNTRYFDFVSVRYDFMRVNISRYLFDANIYFELED